MRKKTKKNIKYLISTIKNVAKGGHCFAPCSTRLVYFDYFGNKILYNGIIIINISRQYWSRLF